MCVYVLWGEYVWGVCICVCGVQYVCVGGVCMGTCVCSGRMWSVCCVHGDVCIVYVCKVYVWYMVVEGFVCGMYMWCPCMHSGRIENVCAMCVMRGCGVCVYDM